MRSLRVLLAFLIALALPAQALAGMMTAAACCPIEAKESRSVWLGAEGVGSIAAMDFSAAGSS